MRFHAPTRRARPESIVPMINVVFLLLVFFLMTADLRPAPPVEVALPAAALPPTDAAAQAVLVATADGGLAFADLRGPAALAAAQAAETPLLLRADRALPGADLARLLAALAAGGQDGLILVTEVP